MNQVKKSSSMITGRKRKIMLVMPFIIIPFLTLGLWALGGGGSNDKSKKSGQLNGLNLRVPDANLKENLIADKMSFYDQADKDSIKLAAQMRLDPYFRNKDLIEQEYAKELEELTEKSALKFNQREVLQSPGLKTSPYDLETIPEEEKILKKLADINNSIRQPEYNRLDSDGQVYQNTLQDDKFGSEVDRLENMMHRMSEKGSASDPDMIQLENTLDKILDIQHPERVKVRHDENTELKRETVYPVIKNPIKKNISLMDNGDSIYQSDGFFGLESKPGENVESNSIEAVVHESQHLINGSVVKFRLLNDVYIKGILIRRGSFIYGIATLRGERLGISITTFRYNKNIFPVRLEAYDLDGMPGLYVPGSITRDVTRESADNSLQVLDLPTLDPSLKSQAASVGIKAAKNLLSKKVRQVKVFIKAGYKVFLVDLKGDK